MWTEAPALETAAAMSIRCPPNTRRSDQSKLHGAKRNAIPTMPRVSPMVRSVVIRSPRKIVAMGTVQRLAVHARTEDRPGGTIWRAVNTRISTSERRNTATDTSTGRSERGGGRSLPVKAVTASTTEAPPAKRIAAIQIGGISRSPIASNGQLTPRVSTVINNNGYAAARRRIGGPLSRFAHTNSHKPGLLTGGADHDALLCMVTAAPNIRR